MIGQTIAHYKVLHKLGEGGMGVVYQALDTRLGRSVALKVLRADAVADPDRKQRFIQEARSASALNHPNIITIYDIDKADGVHYIAMEYVPGQTLHERIGRDGVPLAEALNYGVQIADALAAAHEAGIVHRDLKPANIMVTERGLIKVLDFGLAKLTEWAESEALTRTLHAPPRTMEGVVVGTLVYMSPEQAEGKKVDARSDIFSFGSVLYEMVTGRRAFQADTQASTLSAILTRDPKPISQVAEGLPLEISRIIARCLRKDPERRIQHMGDVKLALEDLKEQSQFGRLVAETEAEGALWREAEPAKRPGRLAVGGIILAVLAVASGAAWWLSRSSAPAGQPVLTRLTSDSGLSASPALSPDGKLLAYASDRGEEGTLDIWVQQIGGGQPIRLTRHEADDYEPAFSPDGTKIAFRSEREGGGIYVISTLGGEPRLIASRGHRPVFSPDGGRIAYWTGGLGSGFVPGSTKVFTVASSGAEPEEVHPEFAVARHPVWSRDGKRLLFLGRLDAKAPLEETLDWWVAPVDGGKAVKTGALARFRGQKLLPPPGEYAIVPGVWQAETDQVLFAAKLGDATNVWEVPISSRTGEVRGDARQRTFGTGLEVDPSFAAGQEGQPQIVFSSLTVNIDVWSLPVQANEGRVAGEMRRLTEDLAFDGYPSVSADGKKLAYVSSRSGNWDVWIRDRETGAESALTATGFEEFQPKISGDGSKIAYAAHEGPVRVVYVARSGGGVPQKLCEDCGVPTHLSSDGRKLLLESLGAPEAIYLLDADSGTRAALVQSQEHPEYIPYAARFSPDERWIVFHAAMNNPVTRQIFVVPFRSGPPAGESDWISVTDGSEMDREAYWSPDGNLVYFLSDRDGFRCIWAQRLVPATKRPAGAAFAIQHFHHARRSLTGVGGSAAAIGLSITGSELAFSMAELTGNIWMMKVEGRDSSGSR